MKIKHFAPFFFLALLSCEGEEVRPVDKDRDIRISAAIDGMKTRVTGVSWEKDDAIGIFMVKTGTPLNSSALEQNVKYVTSGSPSFIPAKEEEEILFPFDNSKVDFVSYYPYREEILNFMYPVDLDNQSQQANIDLMYSDNAKGHCTETPNVGMLFSRQLSKVVLNITHNQSVSLKDLSAIVTNAGTRALFNLATGTLSGATERGNIAFKMSNDGKIAEAILLPEPDLTGMELWFILDDDREVYKFSLANALEINAFKKSTLYTYNVVLYTDEDPIITQCNITDWTDGPSVNATADRTSEDPPLIKGSKKAPFTVAEAQANLGQTQVWVEGYIAGGFAGTTLGSFTNDMDHEKLSASALALADTLDETDIAYIMAVELGTTAGIRDTLNLKDNPLNLHRRIRIKGNLEKYYGAPGLKGSREFEFIDP